MRFARRLVVASSASARRHGSLAEARLTAASLTVPSPSLIIASGRAAIRSLGRGRRGLAVVFPQLERFTRRWRNASALRVMLAWTEFARTTSATKASMRRILCRMISAYTGRGFHHWRRQLRAEDDAARAAADAAAAEAAREAAEEAALAAKLAKVGGL